MSCSWIWEVQGPHSFRQGWIQALPQCPQDPAPPRSVLLDPEGVLFSGRLGVSERW